MPVPSRLGFCLSRAQLLYMLSQLPWVPSSLGVSRKHCFLAVIHQLWILHFFPPPCPQWLSLSLGSKGFHGYNPFRSEHSCLSEFLRKALGSWHAQCIPLLPWWWNYRCALPSQAISLISEILNHIALLTMLIFFHGHYKWPHYFS